MKKKRKRIVKNNSKLEYSTISHKMKEWQRNILTKPTKITS